LGKLGRRWKRFRKNVPCVRPGPQSRGTPHGSRPRAGAPGGSRRLRPAATAPPSSTCPLFSAGPAVALGPAGRAAPPSREHRPTVSARVLPPEPRAGGSRPPSLAARGPSATCPRCEPARDSRPGGSEPIISRGLGGLSSRADAPPGRPRAPVWDSGLVKIFTSANARARVLLAARVPALGVRGKYPRLFSFARRVPPGEGDIRLPRG
jgi:hypothetical protein